MVRTPVQTNHMCDCPNRLHIDVVGTAVMEPSTDSASSPKNGAKGSGVRGWSTFITGTNYSLGV